MGRLGAIAVERLAILAADGAFSYGELADAGDRVAATLLELAGTRGLLAGPHRDLAEARVAFLVPPSFAYAVVLRAIWRAGGVAVPLAVSHPPAELEYATRDSGASIVVGSGRHADALASIAHAAGAAFIRTPDLIAADAAPLALPELAPERRALMIYTSGTTGRPKGVVTSHANVAAQVASLIDAWEWTSSDRALLVLPLHHVHGLINVLGCATTVGAVCEILPQFDTEATWERLASGDITVFTAVPTIYCRLIESWETAAAGVRQARSAGARRVRLMMSGSAALPVSTLERWRDITGHTLLERYGMTEIGMALSNPLHGERRPGLVGLPLPGVEVRLADGELEVRGPGVFLEYWQRPGETRAAFRDGWFRTGDAAALEPGGYRLLGRSNVDILKTGGYKVSALEIEETLRSHPAIADCAVVGVSDPVWGDRVCVAVEIRPGLHLEGEALREWAADRLAPYKVPRGVRTVDTLPRNAMGKIVKADVRRLFSK